eukprot:754234-Hanusia_phi.AAC.6
MSLNSFWFRRLLRRILEMVAITSSWTSLAASANFDTRVESAPCIPMICCMRSSSVRSECRCSEMRRSV